MLLICIYNFTTIESSSLVYYCTKRENALAFLMTYIFKNYTYMCLYECGFVYMSTVLSEAKTAIKFSGNGVAGCCRLPDVCAGNQTQIS